MAWDEAWDYCRTMGMYLVAIESQDKLDVVYNGMFSLIGEIFMNLIDANVNVNVEVYSLKCLRVQQTLQFTSLVLELSLIWSHLL